MTSGRGLSSPAMRSPFILSPCMPRRAMREAPGGAVWPCDFFGDDVRFTQRPGKTSPPYPDIGLKEGEPLREDWFPIVWPPAN